MLISSKRLIQLLQIEHPIIQAPMAGSTNPTLIAAVSNAGGLGSHGGASASPEKLRAIIKEIKQLTDKPFNINLFHQSTEGFDEDIKISPKHKKLLQQFHAEQDLGDIPNPMALFGPANKQLDVLLEEKVPVISFHFGIDKTTVNKAKSAGAIVLCSATTVAEAVILEQAGVDAVIAQSSEAGGHQGNFNTDTPALIGAMALIPSIVDAVSIPVIAAGGIMDARGIIASLALGACGVQMGTAFLGCTETNLAPAWLNRLEQVEAEDTLITSVLSGKPARGIRNRYINKVETINEPLLPYSAQYSISRGLRKKATANGNTDFMVMWAGQGVGLFKQQSVADLMNELVSNTQSKMNDFYNA